jgi:anaerobic nitric oxide reductase flavorubredoxin
MIQVKDKIYWTGIKDWDLRVFHGHELSTHRGSTYNAYIIKDEKTVLVDTVWNPYAENFIASLENDVGLKNIDAIIINHMEPDHGGSLGRLMEFIPDVPIYCSKNGAETIKKHFHKDWNFKIMKTGDVLNTGEYDLVFVEMQMIHWPDSMLTYVKGANVVLSNDAFGQHYSPSVLFNDELSDSCELYQEAIKYYTNILTPYSALIKKKLEQIIAMNLEIDIIAPSHGIIWRKDPMQIVNKYSEWCQDYNEGTAVIIYDTMYETTRWMGEAIGVGLSSKGIKFKMFNVATVDKSDLNTEIFKAKAVIIGSCTVNNMVLRPTAALLDEMKGMRFKNKIGAGFGSYGWSGEAPKMITKKMEEAGFKIASDPISFKYRLTDDETKLCIAFGEKIADVMKGL